MSKYVFRWAVAILVTIMLSLLSVIGKQSPEALANRAQQNSQQSDRNRQAAELIDKVARRGDRMYDLCSYAGRAAAQLQMESLMPLSKCERLHATQNDTIAQMNRIARNGTDADLRTMSQSVDNFMIETAPQLRVMEESYATISRMMREAGKK